MAKDLERYGRESADTDKLAKVGPDRNAAGQDDE